MGIFDGLNSATGRQGGNYLKPGIYQVSINKCATITTRKKCDAFVMNFTVVSSSPAEPGQEPHPLGFAGDFYVQDNPEYPNMAAGNVADFMRVAIASMGAQKAGATIEPTPAGIPNLDAYAPRAVSEEQLLRGVQVRVQVVLGKTKKNKMDFSYHTWSVATQALPVPGAGTGATVAA